MPTDLVIRPSYVCCILAGTAAVLAVMESFRKLEVWQRAHQLTLAVYRLAARLPDSERFGLAAQLRSAAASIPANIAEGCGRRNSWSGNGELIRFLHMAMGSATELEYRLLLAHDLGLITDAHHRDVAQETVELQRMLSRFIARLKELDRFRRRRRPSQAHKLTSSQATAFPPRAD
jgi:four helix bundle protein